jgi:hypothetical protein
MNPRVPIITFLVVALGFSIFFLLPLPSKAEVPTVKAIGTACTYGSCPTKLSIKDNGRSLVYPVNSKITIFLRDDLEPRAELSCATSDVLAPLAIAPPAPYPLYALSFEVKSRGTCTLKSGDFSVEVTGARFR